MTTQFRDRETGEYPITPAMVRERNKRRALIGTIITPEVADLLGYDAVSVEPRPEVDATAYTVTAEQPVEAGGAWTQAWQVTARPDADIAADRRVQLEARIVERCAEVEAIRDRMLQRYPHDFGGDYGVLTLQLRDSDRIAWLTLDSNASKLIAAGQGETAGLLEIRTEENITVPVTPNEASQAMAGLAQYGSAVMAASWQHKDALRAHLELPTVNEGTDAERAAGIQSAIDSVASYNIESGWPV
jgi:hypothetical protein